MKYSAVVLAAFVVTISAQSLSDIPQCAQQCIQDAIKSSTTCDATDYKCICQNQDKLVQGATACVVGACGIEVATGQVLPATQKFCTAVLSGGSGSSTSDTPTSSTPTSSTPTSGSATRSSSSPVTTTSASSATVTNSKATTTAATTTSKGSNSTASSTHTPASVSTAGAATVGSIGGIAMLLLGFAAAL